MRRLGLAITVACLVLAVSATPSLAAIHPIASLECAAASASDVANLQNPVGQLPDDEAAFFNGDVPATGSDLRAVIATGVILVDEDGFFAGVDFTRPALNGDSGVAHCPNG